MTDDEREARKWLTRAEHFEYLDADDAKHRATILALLDAPRMPHPASVPDEVWQAANETFHRFAYTVPGIQAAYRTLYDHFTTPAEPKQGIAWHVVKGTNWVAYDTRQAAEQYQRQFGGRIVKLVEAADE